MEDKLNRAASTEAPVMLTGESGTGRELLARAIHAASTRREKPFIVVTCRSLVKDVLETEIFGRESGTVGGATGSDLGAFQSAHSGPLLLHEIGDLPMGLQVTLINGLRDDHESTGKNRAHTDVRLICSTSDDLGQLIEAGHFQIDLYYRKYCRLKCLLLGRRREDIPLLICHFLEHATGKSGLANI
jgi:DNA-binding NtrC family response regulator